MTKDNDVVKYEDHMEIYKDAELVFEREDRMDINEPTIKNLKKKRLHIINNKISPNIVDYLTIESKRNIAITGNLHSGKGSLIDYMLSTSHSNAIKFTDHHILEIDRKVSIISTPISIQMNGKRTFQFNFLDIPGHSGCIYEMQNLQIMDSCCIVVDVIEGVQMSTRTSLDFCIKHNIPYVVVLNKIDRFITELRLSPRDAYLKLKSILTDLNKYSKKCGGTVNIHPCNNNVVFSSFTFGWCFTMESFASKYLEKIKIRMSAADLAPILWDNYSYKNKKFVNDEDPTCFIDFVLEPLYKVYGIVLNESKDNIKALVKHMGLHLPNSMYKEPVKIILAAILHRWIGDPQPLIDTLATLPSPSNDLILSHFPDTNSEVFNQIHSQNSTGPAIIYITRLYHYDRLMAYGRVLSGTIAQNDTLRCGDSVLHAELFYPFSKTKQPLKSATVGDIILLNVDNTIRPFDFIVSHTFKAPIPKIKPLFIKEPKWLYLAIEPRNASDLPAMLENIIIITRIHPSIDFKVQDSGEYGLFGPCEFIMDCVMHDLRFLCGFDILVSDPVAKFRETVLESSQIQNASISPNLKNVVTTIAEPLDAAMSIKILKDERVELDQHLDKLELKSLWVFGPSDYSTCALFNDVLDDTRDATEALKLPLIQGFQWATNAGPLCDDLMYGIKFKIINVVNESDPSQLPPTMRKSLLNSVLTATPRFVEPMLYCDIVCPQECFGIVSKLLNKRRGNVLSSYGIPCTTLHCCRCQLPAMDSFGFEVDLRMVTQGQAMIYQKFSHYQMLESDPLVNIFQPVELPELQPSPVQLLATDYLLKTRRRKGLGDAIVLDESLKMLFNV